MSIDSLFKILSICLVGLLLLEAIIFALLIPLPYNLLQKVFIFIIILQD